MIHLAPMLILQILSIWGNPGGQLNINCVYNPVYDGEAIFETMTINYGTEICKRANRFSSTLKLTPNRAEALTYLAHEAEHFHDAYASEALVQCRAVWDTPKMALRMGASKGLAHRVRRLALKVSKATMWSHYLMPCNHPPPR